MRYKHYKMPSKLQLNVWMVRTWPMYRWREIQHALGCLFGNDSGAIFE
jgi:hypothetical protein